MSIELNYIRLYFYLQHFQWEYIYIYLHHIFVVMISLRFIIKIQRNKNYDKFLEYFFNLFFLQLLETNGLISLNQFDFNLVAQNITRILNILHSV